MKVLISLIMLATILLRTPANGARAGARRTTPSDSALGVPYHGGTVPVVAGDSARSSAGVPSSAGATDAAPFNLVCIVMDCSRSFRLPSRAPGVEGKVLAVEALRIVQQLFRDGANQRRRRTEGRDLYYVVAADAASQVIWSGTRQELTELTPDALTQKLAVREQFAACTDLEGALNEVAGIIQRHPYASEIYVLTFSDLLHEPPLKSWRKCAPKTGEPPKGIDWNTLARADLGFYFVSKDFPYRPDAKWKAELERRGLQADFFDAAQALTAGLALKPPPPAIYKPTQTQVDDARTRTQGLVQGIVSTFKWVAFLCVVTVASLFGWVAWVRQRGTAARRLQ